MEAWQMMILIQFGLGGIVFILLGLSVKFNRRCKSKEVEGTA